MSMCRIDPKDYLGHLFFCTYRPTLCSSFLAIAPTDPTTSVAAEMVAMVRRSKFHGKNRPSPPSASPPATHSLTLCLSRSLPLSVSPARTHL